MNSHRTYERIKEIQSITEFKTRTKTPSRLRHLAGSPLSARRFISKPRIGL